MNSLVGQLGLNKDIDKRGRTAMTGQPGEESRDRTAETGQPGQEGRDRIPYPEQDSCNRSDGQINLPGQPGRDRDDRMARTRT
jgi:hypothetical protein